MNQIPGKGRLPMITTLSVPFTARITVHIHEIEGVGYWAEVPRFPGCVAQAETREAIEETVIRAIGDWLAESPVKTEAEARQLAAIQGANEPPDESYPQPYDYLPPPSWSEEDE
jgi:predicted RNase H-like HicB family nuclease